MKISESTVKRLAEIITGDKLLSSLPFGAEAQRLFQ